MAKFPRPDMISEGEVKNGVIGQNPNYTSNESGRPMPWSGRKVRVQIGEDQATFGLEEIGWQSPMCDENPATATSSPIERVTKF